MRLGRDAEATAEYERALELLDGHPASQAVIRGNLANLLRRRGDLEGAEQAYLAALATSKELEDLRATGMTQANLASLYMDQGRLDDAEVAYADALATAASAPSASTSTSTMREPPSGASTNVAAPSTERLHPAGAVKALPCTVLVSVSTASGGPFETSAPAIAAAGACYCVQPYILGRRSPQYIQSYPNSSYAAVCVPYARSVPWPDKTGRQ